MPNDTAHISIALKRFIVQQGTKRFAVGSIVKSVTPANIASIKIPLAPLVIQHQIAAEVNHYEKLIAEQKEAVNFLQEKRNKRPRSVWE